MWRARTPHREYGVLPSKHLSLVIFFLFVICLAAAANLGLEPQVHQGLQNDGILAPSLFISWRISVKPNFLPLLLDHPVVPFVQRKQAKYLGFSPPICFLCHELIPQHPPTLINTFQYHYQLRELHRVDTFTAFTVFILIGAEIVPIHAHKSL